MADPLLSISVIGDAELKKVLISLGKDGNKLTRQQIKETAYEMRDEYKKALRPHRKTGGLEKSVVADTNSGWQTAEIGSDLLIALFLEVGTRAHGIDPVRAKLLSWIDPASGERRYARHVDHPGTAANPYLANAAAKTTKDMDEKLLRKIDAYLKEKGF